MGQRGIDHLKDHPKAGTPTKSDYSKLEKFLSSEGLTEHEALAALKQLQRPNKVVQTVEHYWHPKHVKVGIISDTHIGSKDFNYKHFERSVKVFNAEKVDAIYHAGDVLEGMSNRDGHIYELDAVGTTAQMNLAVKLLSQYKQPLFFTTGNHDEWAKKKANQGVIVGPTLEQGIKGSKWLGEYTANVGLAPGVTMRLTHEGSTAYAISYSGQKRVNALDGGTKPAIIVNGHIHKAMYMFYRNIHYFEAGTFQNQTPFMRDKGAPAHVGFWILDVGYDKTGVTELGQKFYPAY